MVAAAKMHCRPLLARTLESVKQGWQHDPGLGNTLLTRLLQDLQLVTSDKSGVSAEGQKRFMRLCSCIEAIVSGCGHHVGKDLPGSLTSPLLRLFTLVQHGRCTAQHPCRAYICCISMCAALARLCIA